MDLAEKITDATVGADALELRSSWLKQHVCRLRTKCHDGCQVNAPQLFRSVGGNCVDEDVPQPPAGVEQYVPLTYNADMAA